MFTNSKNKSDFDKLQRNQPFFNKNTTKYTRANFFTNSSYSPLIQRKCSACEKDNMLQTKLTIGKPDDKYEREADVVADKIINSSERNIQRQMHSEDDEELIQPKHASDDPVITAAIMRQHENSEVKPVMEHVESELKSTRGSGQSITAPVRQLMESEIGADFNSVRLHTNSDADKLNQSLNARAFTSGRDIYFRNGEYQPDTKEGKRLLAHELTHVVQQNKAATNNSIQAEFAVEPVTSNRPQRILTEAEIQSAIDFNRRSIGNSLEIRMLRDILGLSDEPADIDADFVQAVADYQTEFGLTQDGKIGANTRRRLSNEILAESRYMGFSNLGGLSVGVDLRTQLSNLISAGNTNYASYRVKIRSATILQRDVVLADQVFLTRLKNHLTSWDDFARCVELLGRRAPSYRSLIRKNHIRTALAAAWTASNPAVNPPVVSQHEEGGWIYLNLVTNVLSVRRQAAGAGAAIDLSAPPVLADNIVVAKFHTHPNLGPGWRAAPSAQDAAVDATHGVPDIVIGSNDVNPATFDLFASHPDARLHLAGNQGLPGAAGGLAPQARIDGSYDEQ